MTLEQIEPIKWDQVGIVAFRDGVPVAISSAHPDVMAHTILDLLAGDSDGESVKFDRKDLDEVVASFDWELHTVENARKLAARLGE